MNTNHLRLSVIIHFIFTDTNNRIIKNHPRFSTTEKITQKSRLMFLHYVYSLILLCIQRYNRTHLYIKFRQEIL